MRRTFLLWLLILLLAVFAVTGALIYMHLRDHSDERAEQMLRSGLSDMMELLNYESENADRVRTESEQTAQQRTRALDELLSRDSSLLDSHEKLQEMGNLLGAEQIIITDGKGVITHAVPESLEGQQLEDSGSLRDFTTCATDVRSELCVTPTVDKKETLQYAGKHRRSAEGAVILGFRYTGNRAMQSEETFAKLAESYRIGNGGYIAIFRGGNLMNKGSLPFNATDLRPIPQDRVSKTELADTTYYTYSLVRKPYRLVALIPTSDVSESGVHSLRALLLSNCLLFLAMFAVVSLLMQHYVIGGLFRVIESLRRISAGDLNERVDVTITPEFQLLSTDINAMVDTLRFFGEEEREDMNRELELARSIQSAALPSQFPAFPMRTEFDLYATCIPAMTVGGDFYDFFMPDDARLNFLVADISANGIPAALYMMRCMSLIRSIARTGAKPETLARQVNKALCEGQTAGLSLSLFYGSLNVNTGELRFINAGAPQVLLRHAEGAYEPPEMVSGSVMGLFADATYTANRMQLREGDRLFLYSVGVTESVNAENTPFGTERLSEALSRATGEVSEDAREVRTALRLFLGSKEPQEDVTMLVLEYRGRKHSRSELSVAAGAPEGVPGMISEAMEAVFAAPADIADVQATASSVLAALPADCTVTVSLNSTETEAQLQFTYASPRFNPLVGLPHLPVERVEYAYAAEQGNKLTLTKQLS